MKIKYIGHSSFEIKINGKTIVIDPYDPEVFGYEFPETKADILLLSHKDPETRYLEGVSDYEFLIDSPGEYEIGGAFIYGLPTFHDSEEGKERGKNTVYLIEMDGFTVLHLGSLGHELSQEVLEKIGDVDVMLTPVGGNYVIDAETASKVISSLEPGIVIPMHYHTNDSEYEKELDKLEDFLEEMGVEKDINKKSELTLKAVSRVPDETKVVVLKPQH
jgi:L-ascorbate metabolism protein UlaG (beta-lactamase superfamily)